MMMMMMMMMIVLWPGHAMYTHGRLY